MKIKRYYKNLQISAVLGFVLIGSIYILAQQYTGTPVSKENLIRVIKSREYPVPFIVKTIKTQGVSFRVTDEVERELLALKAKQQVIDAAKENYRVPKTMPRNTAASNRTISNVNSRNRGIANVSVREDADENYDQLYFQGLQLVDQLRLISTPQQGFSIAQAIRNTGLEAIKLNSSRPDAYKLVTYAGILTGNFDEAERYAQMAIDRDGTLAFPVYHLAGTPHPEVLHLGKGYISIESDQKFFPYYNREVTNLQSYPNYNAGGRMVAVFSVSTYKNNRLDEWVFSPANTYTGQEAALILRLIRANINK